MEKVLVTTDLSENSLAGLRFAIQLATQRKLELLFLHVNDLWKTSGYTTPEQKDWLKRERKSVALELNALVETTYKSMNVRPGKYHCVLHYHYGVVNSILDYAEHNDCHFICISTRGAGNTLSLLGTTTGELIKESRVPVLCIPSAYEPQPVARLLYASDMSDYERELGIVIAFAKPIHADIYSLNIVDQGRSVDSPATEELLRKKLHYNISFIYEEKDTETTLLENIDKAVHKHTPSLLIMFTDQDRSFFELLFSSSQTEKYSFRTKVPLLSYPKG